MSKEKKKPSQKQADLVGYLEGIISIVLNTALFLVKYWIGLKTASVAILADSWHTLSDSFTSVVVVWGFKSSAKPPDKKHPFGHGRVEVIGSVIIGAVLASVGLNFLIDSIKRLMDHRAAVFNSTALIIFIISVVLKEGIAQFSFWGGRWINSRSLTADAWHHRSDAIASLLILVGIILAGRFWWVDGVLGVMVSLVIFWATYDILRISVSALIGEEPDAELEKELKALITTGTSHNIGIHHLHLHQYGRHKELTFHINLDEDLKLSEAHQIADALERLIYEKMGIDATIHVDPQNGYGTSED